MNVAVLRVVGVVTVVSGIVVAHVAYCSCYRPSSCCYCYVRIISIIVIIGDVAFVVVVAVAVAVVVVVAVAAATVAVAVAVAVADADAVAVAIAVAVAVAVAVVVVVFATIEAVRILHRLKVRSREQLSASFSPSGHCINHATPRHG